MDLKPSQAEVARMYVAASRGGKTDAWFAKRCDLTPEQFATWKSQRADLIREAEERADYLASL